MVSENESFLRISKEEFSKLPEEFRDAIHACFHRGNIKISEADHDLQNLIRWGKAVPTTSSLRYIFRRLRETKFEATMESAFEQEMLTTAFVVAYSRLFVDGKGTAGISRKKIPKHLRSVHDEIIQIRHERYAHNGRHDSLSSNLEIIYDGSNFNLDLQLSFGLFIGGRNEWEELVKFIDEYMVDQLQKILLRLKEKTGSEWIFPSDPNPDFIKES
ncbi:MAG: hypothetical protein HFE69_21475 [Enterobacter hormaechei subsp. steigerwaltii]|nr:hypothetical protein [Enterobacter hormaechei subsp. steigerwaltii]